MRNITCLIAMSVVAPSLSAADDDFRPLFDGKSLDGWKINENEDSWDVEDGAIVCKGDRSHLFYVGDDEDEPASFENFHFRAEVKTTAGSNSGIYFHTRYQEDGWPKFGYECQVNATHGDPKKSSSLYAVENVDAPPITDDEWYTQEIIVRGKNIVLKINDEVMVDFTEQDDRQPFSDDFERRLDEGTFALQAHDPESKCYFRNIQVRRLDD